MSGQPRLDGGHSTVLEQRIRVQKKIFGPVRVEISAACKRGWTHLGHSRCFKKDCACECHQLPLRGVR